jgi:mannosyltransferase OCH1-like enzyme
MIPKIIHQTWKDKHLPPILYNLVSENMKILKSNGYELMFWTDDMILKLINDEYPHLYNIYKLARTGVQRGDIARILVVYHYGGIYIDLDVLILRDFSEILDMNSDKLYITFEPSGQTNMLYNCDNYLCNAFFGANKNNIMLKEILTNIPEYISRYTENIFQKFDIFGGSYFKTIIDNSIKSNPKYKDTVSILYDRELFYPINDLKFENAPFTIDDWTKVKKGDYGKDAVMVHYWIHGDFESKIILDTFNIDNKKTIHQNIYCFFSNLYPSIAKKIDNVI